MDSDKIEHLKVQCESLRKYQVIKEAERNANLLLVAYESRKLAESILSLEGDIDQIGNPTDQKSIAMLERIRMKKSEYGYLLEQKKKILEGFGTSLEVELTKLTKNINPEEIKRSLENYKSELRLMGAINTLACEQLESIQNEKT